MRQSCVSSSMLHLRFRGRGTTMVLCLFWWSERSTWPGEELWLLSTESCDTCFTSWWWLHSMGEITETPRVLVAQLVSGTDWASEHCCINNKVLYHTGFCWWLLQLLISPFFASLALRSSSRRCLQAGFRMSLSHSVQWWIITLISAWVLLTCHRSAKGWCCACQLSFEDFLWYLLLIPGLHFQELF